LQQAAHWASASIASTDDAGDTLNLYDVSGLAHELHKAITQAGNPAGLEVTKAQLVADLKKALDGAIAQAAGDPFQFGFPWAAWDTTRGPERDRLQRLVERHAELSVREQRPLRAVQLEGEVQRRHRVVLDRGAGGGPDRDEPACVRAPRGGTALS
jgi:hypothetical protein